jgi:hypothetical protein
VVTCTLCAFISLVWLREQIVHGGAPIWLEHAAPPFNAAGHHQNEVSPSLAMCLTGAAHESLSPSGIQTLDLHGPYSVLILQERTVGGENIFVSLSLSLSLSLSFGFSRQGFSV